MPKKNILISSGSAKRWSAPGNRLTYDTDTRYISIDNLSSSQLILTGAISGVLINSGGVITSYKAADYSGSYLITNGSVWTVGSAGSASIGPVSGDISGSYPNPRFSNINNINTGSLPVARGGFSGSGNFNLLSSIPSGSLIVANGTASLITISTASYVEGNDYVLASVSGSSIWASVTASAPARDANVQYFTCFIHQWARVMLQAGGGGGGGAAYSTTGIFLTGGGAGGFTDLTVYVGNISSATITVGAGTIGSYVAATRANTGASSSFSASDIFVSAGGGGGGIGSPTGTTIGGVGGTGLTYNGGNGTGAPTAALPDESSGSSGGGLFGGTNPLKSGSIAAAYSLNIAGGVGGTPTSAGSPGNGSINLFGYNIPIGFGSGGGAAGNNLAFGNAGSGISGSGGGGGFGPGGSGNGGDGFVAVISY
jgi:hypothetical protein